MHSQSTILGVYLTLLLAFTAAKAQAQETRPSSAGASAHPQYWFGLSVDNIPPVYGRLVQLKPGEGLLVVRVVRESPADRAGILPGDLLMKVGDNMLTSPVQLIHLAQSSEHKAQVTLIREGKTLTLDIQAEQRPRDMRPILGFAGPESPIVQVGPGILVDLEQADKAPALGFVRKLTDGGQRVMITQESDGQGHIRRKIVVGSQTYEVDPNKLDELPPEVRELARRICETPQERMRRELAALKKAVAELEARVKTDSGNNPTTEPSDQSQ